MVIETVLNGVQRECTPTQQQHQQTHLPPDPSHRPQSAAQAARVPFLPSSPPAVQMKPKVPQSVSGTSVMHPSVPRGSNLSSMRHYPPSSFQHNNYQGSYTIYQPPPFPNAPLQTYAYAHPDGYAPHLPLESGQYSQNPNPMGFRSTMPAHSPLEAGRQLHPQGSGMYPAPHGAPAHSPLPPPGASGSHSTSYTNHQYQQLRYPSPATPYHYNHAYPSPYNWYYGSPVPPAFSEGMPVHFQPHYFSPQQHALPPNLETRFSQLSIPGGPTSPEQRIAPPVTPFAGRLPRASTPASASPATSTHPECHAPSPPPVNIPSHPERPLVRRPYHPNPPSHRSEWVMWVGNVPDDTTHDELWRFLKRQASPGSEPSEPVGDGVSSIFLISRSNCAFVNYDTEESLQCAIARFNGSQLRPQDWRCPKLVCRVRRKEDDLRAGVGGQRGMGVHTRYIQEQRQKEKQESAINEDELSSPVDHYSSLSSEAGHPPATPSSDEEATRSGTPSRLGQCARVPSGSSYASTNSSFLSRHFPKRFFILKSLSQSDLDLSVENGLWATQKHNETILDQAYRTSTEVILIFGVNKSGEFYGYARMAGRISQGEHRVSWASHADSPPLSISSLSSRRQVKRDHDSPLVSNQAFFTPSENRLVEESPLPVTPSTGGTLSNKPSPAVPHRSSAPAALGPKPERVFSAEPPAQKFSLGAAGKAKSVAGLLSKDFASSVVLDKNAPIRAVRNKESTDDTKPGTSSLQPVQEENTSVDGEQQVNEDTKPTTSENAENDGRQNWGQAFKVEWLCTERIPFHRIRHLRNPWNHDREIKVSRDGTELEPGVGQQLLEQWQTLAAAPTTAVASKSTAAMNERAVKSTPALSLTVGK